MNRNKMGGIIPPLVTPMTADLNLDSNGLERLIEHVIEGGVSGIFLLGTTGEYTSLSSDLEGKAISLARLTVKGRVPVFINISTSSHLESLRKAEFASEAGADYTVMSPPFYFDMTQNELIRYYEMVAQSSKLPLLLYNAPQYTRKELEPETVVKLSRHDNIIGIKDSSGNKEYLQKLLNDRTDEDFSIFIGPELLLGEYIQKGCNGGVNGGANIFPKLYVKMYQASIHDERDEMEQWQTLIAEIQQSIYEASDSPMGIVIGLKYALSVLGICSDQMAMPIYDKIADDKKKNVENLIVKFKEYGL